MRALWLAWPSSRWPWGRATYQRLLCGACGAFLKWLPKPRPGVPAGEEAPLTDTERRRQMRTWSDVAHRWTPQPIIDGRDVRDYYCCILLLDVALVYRAAGRSVLPIAPGSKKPSTMHPATGEVKDLAWKRYQAQLPTAGLIQSWFGAGTLMGIGIACGPVSGVQHDDVTYALEVLDVDDAAILKQFVEAATWQGLGELLARLLHQRTPGGAGHFGYLCQEWTGNTKLAQRHDGIDEHGNPVVITLIETRGAGGQVVVAPTPPGIHPEHPERGYALVRGSWEDVSIITPKERQTLWDLARSFNAYVAPRQVHAPRGADRPGANGARPGDTLNETADRAWWQYLLERHGWTLIHQRGDIDYWQRPGKDGKEWSATLGACGPYLYVFSSNAAPFEPERGYQPFSAYALLEHGGDFKAAAKALAPPRQRQNGHRRPPTDATDAQDEPEVPLRERFRVDDKGVWYTPPVDKEGNQPPDVWVCAPLRIVAATRDVDNDKHGHLLEFHDRHGYPQQWAMPLELLEEQREYRKVLRRLGLLMNSAAREALQRYLDVCHAKERARCVDRVGWYGTAYVLPDTTLGDRRGTPCAANARSLRRLSPRQGRSKGGDSDRGPCVAIADYLSRSRPDSLHRLLEPLGEESGGLHYQGQQRGQNHGTARAPQRSGANQAAYKALAATANGLEGVALAHNVISCAWTS